MGSSPYRGRYRLGGRVVMSRRTSVRFTPFVVVLAAVLIAVFALGWADDNAKPCSQGRAQVQCPATQTVAVVATAA